MPDQALPDYLKERLRFKDKFQLKRIPVDKINVGTRVRTDRGSEKEWNDFCENIRKRGLIHPIAVVKYNQPFEGKDYYLLAGGRRLMAHRHLEMKEIDAKIYPDDLSALEIEAIELEENMHRKGLTPAEELAKTKAIHGLYTKMYGEKTSTSPDATGWSMRDTAGLLGVSHTIVAQDLKAASILEMRPELGKKIKNKTELKRMIKKAEKRVETKERLKEIDARDKNATVDMIRERLANSYIQGDFLEKVKKIEKESFGFINLDPDYPQEVEEDNPTQVGINLSLDTGEYHGMSPQEYEVFMQAALKECYRVAQPGAWLIIWFGYEYFQRILDWCGEAGWETNFRHGIWDKLSGHVRNYERYLRYRVEPFIYARKGIAKLQTPHDQIFQHPPDHVDKKINPYQKPVGLMQAILKTYVPVGTRILDCCTGSGNLLLAGNNHRCSGVGFDLSKEQQDAFKVKVYSGEPLAYI